MNRKHFDAPPKDFLFFLSFNCHVNFLLCILEISAKDFVSKNLALSYILYLHVFQDASY